MWNDIRDMVVDYQEGDWGPPMALLVEYRTTMREVVGSNPSQTTTQGLKITEEKVLPL